MWENEKRLTGRGNRKFKGLVLKQAWGAGTGGRPVNLLGGTWKRLKAEWVRGLWCEQQGMVRLPQCSNGKTFWVLRGGWSKRGWQWLPALLGLQGIQGLNQTLVSRVQWAVTLAALGWQQWKWRAVKGFVVYWGSRGSETWWWKKCEVGREERIKPIPGVGI